jgi:hypothetical protein
MTTAAAVIALVLVAVLLFQAVRVWLQTRGPRVVTCPETMAPATVAADAGHAAVTAVAGRLELRLQDCSRWPEKAGCGQVCLDQIESAPDGCLVRERLRRWYEGRSCEFCGRAIAPIHWHDHRPAFKAHDDRIWDWSEIPAETLPLFLATARAVCWNCMIAERFRRDHPELVIDRPRPPRPHRHH